MHGSRTLPVLLLALAAAVPAAASDSEPRCTQILVTSEREGGKEKPGRKFSATTTEDLTFHVLFPTGMSGEHIVELRLYLPTGDLFQRVAVPVVDVGAKPRDVSVSGYPHPLEQKSLQQTRFDGRNHKRVSIDFPIAGTAIINNSLYGSWRVEVYVDDDAEPCGKAGVFEIQP